MNKKQCICILLPVVCAMAVLASCRSMHGSDVERQQDIQQNIEELEQLEKRAPVSKEKTERTSIQKEVDLDTEQQKVLALDADSIDKAQLLREFQNTAIVGDSITAGCTEYGYLNDSIVFAQVGVSVSTAGELFETVVAAAPDTVFLCFGINDIETYESHVGKFIDHYAQHIDVLRKALPDTAIYVQALLPPAERVTKSFYQYRDTYNKKLQEMCSELQVQYVDASFFLEQKPELYDEDGVHPKKGFYPLWLTYFADIAGISDEE